MIFLFSSKERLCANEPKKWKCPSVTMLKFLKYLCMAGLVITLVKFILSFLLYKAVQKCQARRIENILKAMVILFIINSIITFILERNDKLMALY